MFAVKRPAFVQSYRSYTSIGKIFKQAGIVPDIIREPPNKIAQIIYPSGAQVNFGNELTPTDVRDIPNVQWVPDRDAYHTICMTDPDAPSRSRPEYREWHHWLVGNIPGITVSKGVTLSKYIGSAPPKDSGLHRYVFLIYRQNEKLEFDEPHLSSTSAAKREKFSIKQFASKYGLGDPIAGNFYVAQWDNYVPIINKQLGFG